MRGAGRPPGLRRAPCPFHGLVDQVAQGKQEARARVSGQARAPDAWTGRRRLQELQQLVEVAIRVVPGGERRGGFGAGLAVRDPRPDDLEDVALLALVGQSGARLRHRLFRGLLHQAQHHRPVLVALFARPSPPVDLERRTAGVGAEEHLVAALLAFALPPDEQHATHRGGARPEEQRTDRRRHAIPVLADHRHRPRPLQARADVAEARVRPPKHAPAARARRTTPAPTADQPRMLRWPTDFSGPHSCRCRSRACAAGRCRSRCRFRPKPREAAA